MLHSLFHRKKPLFIAFTTCNSITTCFQQPLLTLRCFSTLVPVWFMVYSALSIRRLLRAVSSRPVHVAWHNFYFRFTVHERIFPFSFPLFTFTLGFPLRIFPLIFYSTSTQHLSKSPRSYFHFALSRQIFYLSGSIFFSGSIQPRFFV